MYLSTRGPHRILIYFVLINVDVARQSDVQLQFNWRQKRLSVGNNLGLREFSRARIFAV